MFKCLVKGSFDLVCTRSRWNSAPRWVYLWTRTEPGRIINLSRSGLTAHEKTRHLLFLWAIDLPNLLCSCKCAFGTHPLSVRLSDNQTGTISITAGSNQHVCSALCAHLSFTSFLPLCVSLTLAHKHTPIWEQQNELQRNSRKDGRMSSAQQITQTQWTRGWKITPQTHLPADMILWSAG